MSSDNGYIIIEREDGTFVLHEYSFSADEMPSAHDVEPENVFDTLEEAVRDYHDLIKGGAMSEYGLSIDLLDRKAPNA